MPTIHISKIIPAKTLSSRPSARLLEPAVTEAAALNPDHHPLTFDLRDKLAMAPSFLDELIRIVTERYEATHIRLTNVPSQPTSKFHAVCRSHHLILTQPEPGIWIISTQQIPSPLG